MTTMTLTTARVTLRHFPGFGDLLRSEWIKATSLRPIVWGMISIVALFIGVPVLMGLTLDYSEPFTGPVPEVLLANTVYSLSGITTTLGQVIAGVMGALLVTSEYSSRTIQSTLMASPSRVPSLFAKGLLAFVVLFAVTLASVLVAWAATYPMYERFNLALGLGEPGLMIALVGAAFHLGACAVFGVGIGALVRSTAVGAVIAAGATFGAMLPTMMLPGELRAAVSPFVMGMAGDKLTTLPDPSAAFLDLSTGEFSHLAAWIIVAGWALLAFVAGAIALTRRDA